MLNKVHMYLKLMSEVTSLFEHIEGINESYACTVYIIRLVYNIFIITLSFQQHAITLKIINTK